MARDGAPVFCADVTPGAMDAAVRSAVLRREKGAGGVRLGPPADAKSVAPEMRRADAGLLIAAAGLARGSARCASAERGSRTVLVKAAHKARCADDAGSGCRGAFYPKLMPAVLTLCTCGDYALLGRNSKWPRGFYSTLAGFVDQSESLEQAVAREVLEESGVAIDERSTTYVASQPWPFPCQLMVGFEAKAAPRTVELTDKSARDITKTFSKTFSYPPTPNLDIHELRDARWFHRDWLREAEKTSAIRAGFPEPARDSARLRRRARLPRARQAPHRALGVRGWLGNRLRVRRSRDIEFRFDRSGWARRGAARRARPPRTGRTPSCA